MPYFYGTVVKKFEEVKRLEKAVPEPWNVFVKGILGSE
jgi:hypothetical protein